MVTSRNFAASTDSSSWICMKYLGLTRLFERVIWITWHLPGLRMWVNSHMGQVGLSQVGSGQVGLVRSRPGPIFSLLGMFLIKKRVYLTKLEEGCLILRNIILCDADSIFIPHLTRDTLYQLMSVDIEYP